MSRKATIYLLDDDPNLCDALRMLLKTAGHNVIAFTTPKELLAADLDDKQLGCLILDMRLPSMNGLDVLEELAERESGLPVVVLSGHADVPTTVKAIRGGALDVLEKPYQPEVLLDRVRQALDKHKKWLKKQVERDEIGRRIDKLTPREREVLELMAQGMANKDIAELLGISRKTLDIHRAKVMAKMDVRTVADLVRKRYVESPHLLVGNAS